MKLSDEFCHIEISRKRKTRIENGIEKQIFTLLLPLPSYLSCKDLAQTPLSDRNGRYTALNHGSKVSEDGVEYVEMEKRSRDRALSICRDYIEKTPRFALIKQLNNIGEPALALVSVRSNRKPLKCRTEPHRDLPSVLKLSRFSLVAKSHSETPT